MGFENKTAVVTGGSRGIGREICIKLAERKAKVVFCYTGNEKAAEETLKCCRSLGAEAAAIKCNVAEEEEVKVLIDTAVRLYGRIDILINNAGITRDRLLLNMSEEDFEEVIDINLKGTFLCMKHASKLMLKQRSGRIVSLSSIVGLRGNAGQVNYSASKAGIIGMTKSLARELASRGITVNAVAPGFVETDMTAAMPEKAREAAAASIPMAKLCLPEDIANAVLFLASDEARFITGQVIAVDGGMSM